MCELIQLLGRDARAIYAKAQALGLHRSGSFLASEHSGRLSTSNDPGTATRFQKGNTAWNKNKPFRAGGRSEQTQFAQGAMPHNHVDVGTEVLATDGYMKIKVEEPNVWEWSHRRNWEAVNGPIPKGHALVFKDGNRLNCEVENLELLTRSQLMLRNTIHRYPPELKGTIRQLGKLKRAIEAADEK